MTKTQRDFRAEICTNTKSIVSIHFNVLLKYNIVYL